MRIQVGDVRLFVDVVGLEWVPDGASVRWRRPSWSCVADRARAAALDAPEEFRRITTGFVLRHAPASAVDGKVAAL